MDKGKAPKLSYIHTLNPLNGTALAAEMTHRFSLYENNFTLGCSHAIDHYTRIKTRFSNNGMVAFLCQREWRPKSLVTFSAEYDWKGINVVPKLALALMP
ncbi:Eukaryotic porin/Tom40 protein [Actinidia chinensis var. chinensis]|uniref:Eukaryotic porin/Tom40 protein n=1 Tax=Actinidia chinensis var. chinensis TaxID=1590841 RepID=A0A2R6S1R9_ACTCC|nr:Eukaryotic porin/Tom40 protein [Actinidia chinensis var. chinensis]